MNVNAKIWNFITWCIRAIARLHTQKTAQMVLRRNFVQRINCLAWPCRNFWTARYSVLWTAVYVYAAWTQTRTEELRSIRHIWTKNESLV